MLNQGSIFIWRLPVFGFKLNIWEKKQLRVWKSCLVLCFLALSISSSLARGVKEEAPETVTVRYAFWGNPETIAAEQDIIYVFEATHPGIHIEPMLASSFSDYHSTVLSMIASGVQPDVIKLDNCYYQDFQRLGALAQLDRYLASWDTSVYPAEAMEEVTLDGHVYGLPCSYSPVYLALNLDTFSKAGLDLPEYDWDIDCFIALLKAFGGDATGVYGWASQFTRHPFYPFLWAGGADLLTPDRQHSQIESGVRTLEAIAGLYQEGYLPRDMVAVTTQEPVLRWFAKGTVAMITVTAEDVLALKALKDVRFALYPFPGGAVRNTTPVKTDIAAMTSSSLFKDEAWEFLSFLCSLDGHRLYTAARCQTPSFNTEEDLWALYLEPYGYPSNAEDVTKLIYSDYQHQLPLRPGFSELDGLLLPVFKRIMTGSLSAEEGLEELSGRIEAVLSKP